MLSEGYKEELNVEKDKSGIARTLFSKINNAFTLLSKDTKKLNQH